MTTAPTLMREETLLHPRRKDRTTPLDDAIDTWLAAPGQKRLQPQQTTLRSDDAVPGYAMRSTRPLPQPTVVPPGPTTNAIAVSLPELRRAVQFASIGAHAGPWSPRTILGFYVGDPSEVGPHGELLSPACLFDLMDDARNLALGIDPAISTLYFTTLRTHILCITCVVGSPNDPRVYRYDTVRRRIDGVRPLVLDAAECRVRLQRGEELAHDWLASCASRTAHGQSEDYTLATDPAVFHNCRARFHFPEATPPPAARPAVVATIQRPVITCLAPAGLFRSGNDLEADIHLAYRASRARIELVPKPCWYANLRSSLAPPVWRTLSTRVREQAGWRCAACGATPSRDALDAHEHWRYDDHHQVQLLAGIVCLCSRCHEVRHAGRAALVGRAAQVHARLMKLNAWSDAHANAYGMEILTLWEARSQHTSWRVDITWLEQAHGIGPMDFVPPSGAQRGSADSRQRAR